MQSSVKASSTSATIVTVFHKKDSISILSALWITYLHRDVTYKTCTYTNVLDSRTNTNSSTRILDFLHSRNIKTLQQQAFLPERLIKISKITLTSFFSLAEVSAFFPSCFFLNFSRSPGVTNCWDCSPLNWSLDTWSAGAFGRNFLGSLRVLLRGFFIHHELRARNEKSQKKP